MANLAYAKGRWINLDKPSGIVYFVGGGTPAYLGVGRSDTYKGLTPERPLSTLSGAHDKCTSGRGDTIVLLPGSVSLTSTLTIDSDDVTISGTDPNGWYNPSSVANTMGSSTDVITVTGANVTFENLHFGAAGAACTAIINVAAAGVTIRDCSFNLGQYNVNTITIPAAGDDLTVQRCKFYVTADGPDSIIEPEAAGVARLRVVDCWFDAGTDGLDEAAIYAAGNAITSQLVAQNMSFGGMFLDENGNSTGVIAYNVMGGGTLGSMLDPGTCMCFENYEADAADETGREFPTGAAA